MVHSIDEHQKPRTSIEISAFSMGVYEHPWLTCELLALHQHLARTEAALLLTGDWRIDADGIVSHVFDGCSDCIGCY